jgi:hypothetical protein
MSVSINRFNPRKLNTQRKERGPPVILFIGARGTGKSFACKDIVYYLRKIPTGVVMSGTTSGCQEFGKVIPKSFIYEKLKMNVIKEIIQTQSKKIKKAPPKDQRREDLDTLLLLEDCMADKKPFKTDEMREIFMNGRHLGICFIMNLQYSMDIPPALRGNIDYVFATREVNHSAKKKLYEHFFGCIKSYKRFDEIFSEVTKNNGLMVLDRTDTTGSINKMLFYYKATYPARNYHFGSKKIWLYHEQKKAKQKEDRICKKQKAKTNSSELVFASK